MPWLAKSLTAGTELVLYGKVRQGRLTQPEYEVVRGDDTLHVGRIVPIYPLTKGITAPALRRAVFTALERALDQVEDPLPPPILARRALPPLREALTRRPLPAEPRGARAREGALPLRRAVLLRAGGGDAAAERTEAAGVRSTSGAGSWTSASARGSRSP